jgi:signal transduction histidine kinase/CheY-like chemotaxis protein
MARVSIQKVIIMSTELRIDQVVGTLQQWSRISAEPGLSSHERLEQLLRVGCRALGMELGAVLRVEGGQSVVHAFSGSAGPSGLQRGYSVALSRSFCAWTLRAARPVSFHHASKDTLWSGHPIYTEHGMEACIGCVILVGRMPWGSLNFYSVRPRAPFGSAETSLIELMAGWLGHELTRDRDHAVQLHYFDKSRDLLAECHADGEVLRVNAAWSRVWGEEGAWWVELVDRRDRAVARLALEQAWEGGDASLELRTRGVDGEARWLSCWLVKDEELGRLIVSAHDITALKHAKERLIEAKEEAEAARDAALEAGKTKAAFLASVSHDLRTPMNGILGLSELLLQTPLQGRQHEWVEMIHQSGQTLLTLINDVLDLSRIEASGVELLIAPLDPRLMVEEVALLVAERAQRKGLELSWRLAPGLPTEILGDVGRLKQILLNLLGNAVKFTERGAVLLRLFGAPTSDPGVVSLTFEVQDSGPGIPLEQQAMIFEPFRQLHDTQRPRQAGSGLGLSIARQLAELMNGTLTLESAPGQGSCFRLTLAARLSEAARDEAHQSLVFSHLPTALIADAHREHAQHIASLMAGWGLNARVVGAAPLTQRMEEDVVLIDVELPGASDWINACYARSGVLGQTRPWLIAIGPMGVELDVPADAHLERPVRRHLLLQTLQRLLRSRMLPAPETGRDVTLTLHEDTLWEPLSEEDSSVGHILDEMTTMNQRKRALVVEDNAINIRLMREFLGRLAWEVEVAETGEQALEMVVDGVWDVILMDCQLPGIDGYTAARRIRELEPQLGVCHTIYALTAHAMRGERERVLEAGMDDFLTKPIGLKTLSDALERATRRPLGPPRLATGVLKAPDGAVDMERWRALLRDCGGDVGFVGGLVEDFATDGEAHVASMEAEPSPVNLKRHAHALRGAGSQFGLAELGAVCLAIELRPDEARRVAQARSAYTEGIAALRALIALASGG